MVEEEKGGNNGIATFFAAVFLIACAAWAIHRGYDHYMNSEKSPFWKDTDRIQVCKQPYYSSEDCYKLNVTLLEDKQAQIHFPNGGYKITGDLTCYFAASVYKGPRYVFCRSWDDDDQQWDFLPIWVNY